MKITAVEATLLSVPFPKPIRVATGSFATKDVVFVEVRTDEGLTGMGYLGVLGAGAAALKVLVDRDVAALVVGEDPRYRARIWDKLWWGLDWIGRRGLAVYALSLVDVALWDLAGRAANQSIHQLLGPYTDRVKAYASGGNLGFSLEEVVAEALAFRERGFRAYKMKVGLPDIREDLRRVDAVRDALGPDVDLMADANQGLDVAHAILLGRELERRGVFWFEEPVPADDIRGSAEIARALDIRLATGETEFSRFGFADLIRERAADILQIDVRAGGITEWMRIAAMAGAAGIPVTPHMQWELQIHMTAAVPNGMYVEYMSWFDELFEELPAIEDGYVVAPQKPGHGLAFKPEMVRRYRVD